MNDWKVIEAYYKSPRNTKYVTNHHLNSFNTFIRSKVPYIINTLNPFIIVKQNYQISVFIGGRDGSQIFISKPCDKDKNALLPNVARLNDDTYTSELYVDVLIEYQTTEKDGTVSILESVEKMVPIGEIPIMVHSDLCVLKDLNDHQVVSCGECPYDQGGYFIIDGKEKVIVSQERVATNKLFLSVPTSDPTASFSHEGIIRCTSKENSLFPKTIQFKVYKSAVKNIDKKMGIVKDRKNAICITIPNIEYEIPLFILFRALGIETDKDILTYIFPNLDNVPQKYVQFIRKTIHEGSVVHTQEEALLFLSRYCKYTEPNFVRHVLTKDAFPNMGSNYTNKTHFLGYLSYKLIQFALGEISSTNRDSYLYKRVDSSGVLMTNTFRDGYNQLRNNIKNKIDREFTYGNYRNMKEFNQIISSSMNHIFDKGIITAFIRKSFKGKWGLRDTEGIVQDLNRLSYMGYVSHTMRVNTPMDRSLKLVTPHRADASQWGYMCPIESPDGENIGLLKHMACFCHISEESSEEDLVECLQKHKTVLLKDFTISDQRENSTMIFLNNNWIGLHRDPVTLLTRLKALKLNNIIDQTTSISWNIEENVIEIFNDAGRCVRPVYVNGSLSKVRTIMESKDTDKWFACVAFQNQRGYLKEKDVDDIKLLQKTAYPLEFIDSTETSRSLIAMDTTFIDKYPMNRYDYIEIHASTALSMYTNTIPLSHHNQAPRNIFSGAQGKQSVGVYASSFNNRIDTSSYILHYSQQALLTTKYAQPCSIHRLPNGENVIVAIATYTGYNQEDSLIINKTSLERGLFNSSIYKAYVDSEDTNENTGDTIRFANPLNMLKHGTDMNVKYAKWDKIDDNGFPLENTYIQEDDVFVGKVKTEPKTVDIDETSERVRDKDTFTNATHTFQDKSEVASFTNGGMVDKVYVYEKNGKRKLKIRFRKTREPVLGDKFASRHGQKGVIGMIMPQEDMMFTKDGLVPDLIVNPHAFPSRMTIGHLFESILAKYSCISGHMVDGTVFEKCDTDSYFNLLRQHGYQKHGDEIMMNGFTGEQIKTEIFIGPTYYYRLKHMVNDKMNYRGGNGAPVTSTTRQPTQGRANQGGLRIGEMETNALLAHGMGSFAKESMMERSDKYKYLVDVDNGVGAIPIHKTPKSYIDDDSKTFAYVEVPYSFKLLTQELNALSIKPKLICEEKNKVQDEFFEDDDDDDDRSDQEFIE